MRRVATFESISRACWEAWSADLWWMSPPCQPFTHRGRQRDLDDSRCAFWHVLLQRLADLLPRYLIVENVPPFQHSRAFEQLAKHLARFDYRWTVWELCPTELGIPNRRRRCYLLASRGEWIDQVSWSGPSPMLRSFLDAEPSSELNVFAEWAQAYRKALHVVDAGHDDDAVAACFTAAYGRSMVRSGSYLKTRERDTSLCSRGNCQAVGVSGPISSFRRRYHSDNNGNFSATAYQFPQCDGSRLIFPSWRSGPIRGTGPRGSEAGRGQPSAAEKQFTNFEDHNRQRRTDPPYRSSRKGSALRCRETIYQLRRPQPAAED